MTEKTEDLRDALAKALCAVEMRSKAATIEEVVEGVERWTRHRYEAERLMVELVDYGVALAVLSAPQEPGCRELIVMVGDVGHVISDSDVERFWSRVDMSGADGCWNWTSDMTKTGYGQFDTSTRKWRAHRLAYEMLVKPIPAGLVIDHLCRNRACVNPDHFEIVTHRENTLRGDSPAAQQARQSHCKRGHLLSGDNVHKSYANTGRRRCVACWVEPVVCEDCGESFRRDYMRQHRRRMHSERLEGAIE